MNRNITIAILAFGTLIGWFVGVSYLFVAFSETAFERALDAVYPFVAAVTVATFLGYVLHAPKSGAVPREKRVLWAVVLFLATIFAEPFYFWFYVWPGKSRAS